MPKAVRPTPYGVRLQDGKYLIAVHELLVEGQVLLLRQDGVVHLELVPVVGWCFVEVGDRSGEGEGEGVGVVGGVLWLVGIGR